jgi:predicted acylesterase/phospholipase RssA
MSNIAISQSGGEIKAAFLGGMLAKLLESGVEPIEVLGTSAGALNTFLVSGLSSAGLNYKQIGS